MLDRVVSDEIDWIHEHQEAMGDRWFGLLRLLHLEKSIETSHMRRLFLGLEIWLLDIVTMAAFDFMCWRHPEGIE